MSVCTSCTVSTRNIKTHYGILAMSVTFTPEHVTMFVPQDDLGSWKEHLVPTGSMNTAATRWGASRVTTMLAVAISSAAVSPPMGRFKVGPTSMRFAFANIRLGVWVPNPRYVEAAITAKPNAFPKVRFGYFMKEFLGIHDPSTFT